MEPMYTIYRRYRAADEGEDRAVRVIDDGVELRQGPIDGDTQHRVVPQARCAYSTPWKEVQQRTRAWTRDGYARIGLGRCEAGRLELGVRDENARVALHWQATAAIDRARWAVTVKAVAAALRGVGVQAAHRRNGPTGSSLEALVLSGVWRLDRLIDGRFGAHGRAGVATIHERDCTVPILVLMRIERAFPGSVAFTWRAPGEHQPVAPHVTRTDLWLGSHVAPFGETLQVACALGLMPAQRVLVAGARAPEPIWF